MAQDITANLAVRVEAGADAFPKTSIRSRGSFVLNSGSLAWSRPVCRPGQRRREPSRRTP